MVQSRVLWQHNARYLHDKKYWAFRDLRRMAWKRLAKVQEIDLSYKGMDSPGTELSWTLFALPSLRKLNLSHSELHKIPSVIGFLLSLTHLFLNDNYLLSVEPEIIRQLVNLQELDLRNNKLDDFSLDITELSYLQRLSVQGNPLKDDETRKLMMLAHWIEIDIAGECKIL